MSTLLSFGVKFTSSTQKLRTTNAFFSLQPTSKSSLFILLLLTMSAVADAAVESLEPFAQPSTAVQQANSFEFNCFADENPDASNKLKLRQLAIGLQVTNDITHQLITRIFAIFLRDVLHYQNITLIPINYSLDVNDTMYERNKLLHTLGMLDEHPDFYGLDMINLGIWMSPFGHGFIQMGVSPAGPSMPSGRFGWFVAERLLARTAVANATLDYTIFLDPANAAYETFMIDAGVLEALQANNTYEWFVSPKCVDRQCVTLLAEYRRHTSFVQHQIIESGSYVNVLWLNDHFRQKILHLYKSYHDNETYFNSSFIVLHWTPSDVIEYEGIQFTQINMPRCEDSIALQYSFCKYEMTPVLKYFSKSLATNANYRLVEALYKFYISDRSLDMLHKDFHEQLAHWSLGRKAITDDIYNWVACNWMGNNNDSYSKWIVKEPEIKLSIGGIFPISDTSRGHQHLVRAVRKARDAINGRTDKNYTLTVFENDGKCQADVVLKNFIHYFSIPEVLGVLGPACSETVEPIAGISKHTRMAVISYSAEGASFVDRQTYPYFFRTIGSNRQYEDVYVDMMQSLGWNRVAALTEDGQKYTEYLSHMEGNMKKQNLELIVNKKFLSDITAGEMNKHLEDLRQRRAKIIIADIHNRNAELALCEAYKLGMTAYDGYVWFLPPWLSKDWHTLSKRSNGSCSAEDLMKAYDGHFTLMHTPFGNLNSTMQEGITVQQWLKSNEEQNVSISNYAGFAYDAVWAYALAADKLLNENKDVINNLRSSSVVKRFVEFIWETDFEGLSGRVRFGEGGSRISEVDILQWRRSEYKKVGKFVPKAVGKGSNLHLDGGTLLLEKHEIQWLSGAQQPSDGTYDCSLSNFAELIGVDCDRAVVAFTAIFCLMLVVLISLVSFFFWKRLYDKKLKKSAKIMKNFGIDLLSPSRNKTNTLDKWEIPKENVVVNRRLGEGAFGTVYGGEAQLKSEGWTAVAVKTLKAGASTEDRLDFLSEAEAMKRLDHKNIVKLLGVCLQSEPIYTIMEFMLYGDLKTYLLARRHMVNDKISDESDICPKRLTMYAMDVARGLAYLAQQKYVHRDLACRNCLVNAQRVVKLGDFGMARPTFESDYYRFNRKGMLPVRWMAPEALALGMFTPASDVWAFGVVVFEIVTFGSFPFQGLTNNQVLECVKNGKTLQVPVDAKPQLENLLKDCWQQDTKKRPTAAELIDCISNHPRLLTPCLDFPGASVEMPETESDELELLPKSRKCSPIKRDSTLDIIALSPSVSNFERTRALIDSIDFMDDSNMNIDMPVIDKFIEKPNAIGNFSPITPDGYSIMSPLLMHQVSENSDSSQARLLQKYSTETLQQTPF